ncbi:MAG: hypothetical protein KME60_17720 [Cyanomargarita calcarea GSE-NOS-MK-12-04C]|uniref:Uncharacterized protein n=1 Tax=Cyanomargarita calcarea GSE-NOS-MK-12-04C TaxID=2839659 RepID=A0A951UU42_9CYAN|nr:hypothetical protein [Cyanomargarita calcarea GSE-NOS-MK-12-04C]
MNEGKRKKEEGRRKKEEGRRFIYVDTEPQLKTGNLRSYWGIKPEQRG